MWVVRSAPMLDVTDTVEDAGSYINQFTHDVCPVEVESAFASLVAVCGKRDAYAAPGQLDALDDLVRQEVAKTYLDRLLRHARAKLDALAAAPEPVTA